MNQLQLKRPLVFFDLETTGPDRANDRIIQFCFMIYYPDGSYVEFTRLVNPGMPISPKATEVHHITDQMVERAFPFSAYAAQILDFVSEADIVGYGILMFDVPLLHRELSQAGLYWDYTRCNIIDSCNIYKRNVPRDLTSAFRFYCNSSLVNAHDAKADTLAAKEVFLFQLERHDLEPDFAKLALYSNYDQRMVDLSGKFTMNDQGEILINFSSKKGQRAKDNIDFLWWMLDRDFPEDVKAVCRRITDEAYENGPYKDMPF